MGPGDRRVRGEGRGVFLGKRTTSSFEVKRLSFEETRDVLFGRGRLSSFSSEKRPYTSSSVNVSPTTRCT